MGTTIDHRNIVDGKENERSGGKEKNGKETPSTLRHKKNPPAEKLLYQDKDKIPGWAIALIVVFCVLCVLFFAFAFGMYLREKQGKPMFLTLGADKANKAARQSRAKETQKETQLNEA